MNENENLEVEQISENTEHTAEQTPKTYTQEEVDAIVGKAKARTKAKILKDVDRKYGRLEEVLKAGTGKESVEEMTDTFAEYYENKGFTVPQKAEYSDRDVEILAAAEAADIISAGHDEIVEETDRLAKIGAEKMTPREKIVFKTLAEHLQNAKAAKELAEIGVTEDVYESPEFKAFAKKFDRGTPIKDVYDIYRKTQPQKEYKPMGSMKSTVSAESEVKDYYSPEEARRFTRKELDNNPALVAAIEKSMQKWK